MNKVFRFMTITLILCIVFITGCSKGTPAPELIGAVSPKLTNTIKTLKLEDIKYLRIQEATGVATSIKYYTFDFNNPNHTKVIKDVVYYLNSAKIQGNDYEELAGNKGGSPTFLILALKDGSVIQITDALRQTAIKGSTGARTITTYDIPNEVTITAITTNSNYKSFRILSKELRKLIDNGYKDIFRINSSLK